MTKLIDENALREIIEQKESWTSGELAKVLSRFPEMDKRFSTISDMEIKNLYTPEDIADLDYERDLGNPGQYPFTRGVQPTMYRGRYWTMRQFAGFGTPEDTNKRFHFLLDHGETGLSTAFDYPTLMGYDSDSERSHGEIGKCGVAIDSVRDMEVLFDGIPLDKVTTSMTINPPASILLAMYLVVAEKQGIPYNKLGGTSQNDILKEYIAQKSWIFPPRPSMRLITDMIEFCTEHVPKWNTISISGYHIREAGSTAVQELAFTLADGIGYVQACVDRGMDVDAFAGRLSYFFNAHSDFFEELAKYRAARRMWAKIMKERFGAKNPRSWMLRFHTQTAGCSLTAQQPYNNVVRTTIQAMAAVMGGTQSLHTNSLDETLSLPTESAVTIALRTQQIIAEESGITNTIDPLGGSYFVEAMTNRMEKEAFEYIHKIDEMGGIIPAIERGFPQKEIADAAYHYNQQTESLEKTVVGVNKYKMKEEGRIPILYIDEEAERRQVAALKKVKAERDQEKVAKHLETLRNVAGSGDNTFPHILNAVRDYVTEQEICDAFRQVFGEYQDPAYI